MCVLFNTHIQLSRLVCNLKKVVCVCVCVCGGGGGIVSNDKKKKQKQKSLFQVFNSNRETDNSAKPEVTYANIIQYKKYTHSQMHRDTRPQIRERVRERFLCVCLHALCFVL
jgi:hypothetical protein